MTHEERLAAAGAFRVNVLNERARLREQLAAKTRELLDLGAAAERWRVLAETNPWAEYSSGHAFKAGDRVRHLGRIYVCRKAHTKALTRSPLDAAYWEAE